MSKSNEETLVLDIITVRQPIGTFYLTKIKAKTLLNMARSDIVRLSKHEDFYDGIQRELNPQKVSAIRNYLTATDATFPNNVILNINETDIISCDEHRLVINKREDVFSILDGQHRVMGFDDPLIDDFDLCVSIFSGLQKSQQGRIFVTINSEQTKVNPSVSFYQEVKENIFTPRKMIAKLSIIFNTDIDSPWKNKIKLIGIKDELASDGRISLNTFVVPILNGIYNDEKSFNTIRNTLMKAENKGIGLKDVFVGVDIKRSYLWDLYIDEKENLLYKILLNYFNAMKDIFKKDWENKDSILTKSTGYNAMMYLFKDLYMEGLSSKTLTKEFFDEKLKGLKNMDGTINSSNYGASGEKASKDLCNVFRSKL